MPFKPTISLALIAILQMAGMAHAQSVPAPLATVEARAGGKASANSFDGVVEAVRQTVLAAQVAGAIVELRVKAGDTVKAGQVVARIDARAAQQTVTASQAQVDAARAALEVAGKDLERQKLLFQKRFISQAALDQVQSVYDAAKSQVAAQSAQAGVSHTQSDFFILRAPYNGIVAEVSVVLGDMAMPGRGLLTVYDPSSLRVTATVPESIVTSPAARAGARIELPGASGPQKSLVPRAVTVLPTADPNTHTVQIRLDLPAGTTNVLPGMFARAWLPVQGSASEHAGRVFVPITAVVRRAEMIGVYVLDPAGKPVLRQVRIGPTVDDAIEVLTGLAAGERVVVDAQAAARLR